MLPSSPSGTESCYQSRQLDLWEVLNCCLFQNWMKFTWLCIWTSWLSHMGPKHGCGKGGVVWRSSSSYLEAVWISPPAGCSWTMPGLTDWGWEPWLGYNEKGWDHWIPRRHWWSNPRLWRGRRGSGGPEGHSGAPWTNDSVKTSSHRRWLSRFSEWGHSLQSFRTIIWHNPRWIKASKQQHSREKCYFLSIHPSLH